jgi:exonuclease III
MDLIDICRVFHQTVTEYTFFSAAHRTFCKIDHILGHKANLNKCKKIGIISSDLSDQKLQKIYEHVETEQFTLE